MRVDVGGKVSKGGLGVVFPGGYISVAGDWPGLSGETGCGMPRCLSWHNKQPSFYPSSRLPLWLAQPPELSLCLPCLPACPFTQPSVALTEVMRDRPDAIALLWFLVS